mmetsp:Transcript_10736/g.39775  ORF Transcript_10736/g.39775 Transcript_10736/m.39775 type:complete len:438 (-) Transcript_10736:1135-2448(-)
MASCFRAPSSLSCFELDAFVSSAHCARSSRSALSRLASKSCFKLVTSLVRSLHSCAYFASCASRSRSVCSLQNSSNLASASKSSFARRARTMVSVFVASEAKCANSAPRSLRASRSSPFSASTASSRSTKSCAFMAFCSSSSAFVATARSFEFALLAFSSVCSASRFAAAKAFCAPSFASVSDFSCAASAAATLATCDSRSAESPCTFAASIPARWRSNSFANVLAMVLFTVSIFSTFALHSAATRNSALATAARTADFRSSSARAVVLFSSFCISVFSAVLSLSACAIANVSSDCELCFKSLRAFSSIDAAEVRSKSTALTMEAAYFFSSEPRFSLSFWLIRRDSAFHHSTCSLLRESAARYLRISLSCSCFAASRSNLDAASFPAITARSSAISRSTFSIVFSSPEICALSAVISASCVFFKLAISVSARSFRAS